MRSHSQWVHTGSDVLLSGGQADAARKCGHPSPAPPGGRAVTPPQGNSWRQRTPASGLWLWSRSSVWDARWGRGRLVWRCWSQCSKDRRCIGKRRSWGTPSLPWTRGRPHAVLRAQDRPISAPLKCVRQNEMGTSHQRWGLYYLTVRTDSIV